MLDPDPYQMNADPKHRFILFFPFTAPVVDVVEVPDSVLGPYDEVQEDGSHIQSGNKLMLQHNNRFYHPNVVLR
jgi:hypothetical protein